MSTNEDDRPVRRRTAVWLDRLRTIRETNSRPDVLLGLVPAGYLIGVLVAGSTAIDLVWALGLASIVGYLVIVDACYLRPPTDGAD